MDIAKKPKTHVVKVGNVLIGGGNPVVIQSMTNTPTADVDATAHQIVNLSKAGAELVRITVNDESAAKAVTAIIQKLKDAGCETPLIGDFHFNGHTLLSKYPQCAKHLAKYRINPGNIGKGRKKDDNFAQFIKVALDNNKPVRIGVNSGSLDESILNDLKNHNKKQKHPKKDADILGEAMVHSALQSSQYARKLGLPPNKIILSVKMSHLPDMVNAYARLAEKCSYPLHLGLTEAGGNLQGIVASSAALGILLHQGIGDTIRVSLTPDKETPRSQEVLVCQLLLQSLGLRYFSCKIISCPGCGRTDTAYFNRLAEQIKKHITRKMPQWKQKYPGVEKLTIAIMGCVVNGPGESRHADIGISLPGANEKLSAPVYADGKKLTVIKNQDIKKAFIQILEDYLHQRFQNS